MKALTKKISTLQALVCAALLVFGPMAWSADTNFNGNVGISSNLVVGGTLSATNIVPNQVSGSVSIFGSNSDGTTNGGGVVISGGVGGYNYPLDQGTPGGDVILVGGEGGYHGGAGGDVILQGGPGGYTTPAGDLVLRIAFPSLDCTGCNNGSIQLQTYDGTTRFSLQTDGTLNANGNYIASARILPQGDLIMGSFTNSP